mgnify:CR=1 FL=1
MFITQQVADLLLQAAEIGLFKGTDISWKIPLHGSLGKIIVDDLLETAGLSPDFKERANGVAQGWSFGGFFSIVVPLTLYDLIRIR